MEWTGLWIRLFGKTTWLGINMGFWVSMGITALIVIAMNLFFWKRKPYRH